MPAGIAKRFIPAAPWVFTLLLCCVLLIRPALALEEPLGDVNWVGGYIRGIGYGTANPSGNKAQDRLLAIRAAEVIAQRALAETINGVKVDGVTAVRDAMKEFIVSSHVEGVIRGAQKVHTKVTWDGDTPQAMVELRICLVADAPACRAGNSLISALTVKERTEPSYVPAVYYEYDAGSGAPADKNDWLPKSDKPSYDPSRPVTGLVLRLKGTRYEKELFPVVVTRGEGGKLLTVYSAKIVRPDVIKANGIARYADAVDQGLKDTRLGDNPLMVAVSEVTKENMLVIREEGARAIRETSRYGNDYLANGKVVIVGK